MAQLDAPGDRSSGIKFNVRKFDEKYGKSCVNLEAIKRHLSSADT